jgi:hypothetical protein
VVIGVVHGVGTWVTLKYIFILHDNAITGKLQKNKGIYTLALLL